MVMGGSGFLGSHTADLLSEQGYRVTIFDREPSPWLRGGQEMVVGDILDAEKVGKIVADARYVFHFAGIADICESKTRPYDTINLNVIGTTIAMQAAVDAGVDRFIYASTIYVYSPHGSFYRASKQAAETIIDTYHKEYGIHYTLLRYGSLYGPRSQRWNGVRRYVEQVVREGRLDYSGTGEERREFIHVRDAAQMSIDILGDMYKNQAITITGPQIMNLHELIDMIFEISGKEKNVIFKKGQELDHYVKTPYRYTPKQAKKIVPAEFIDLGQGILDLVEEIHNEMES